MENTNCYQVITNIQPCLFSQDILDERGERLSQESHELTSKGIWPFPESNHETFNKIRQKMKEVHFEAKTKKMQDRISAAGHTFWLNQELGLKRVAAPLLLLAKLNFITFLSKIANWIVRYAQISLLHLVPSHKLYFLLNLYWLFEKKYYSSKF